MSTKVDLLSNPAFKSFIESFSKLRESSENYTLDEIRRLNSNFFTSLQDKPEQVKRIENVEIEGPDKNKILIRFFIPDDSKKLPVLIYFHRGGWVFGSVNDADSICRKLANHLHQVVASVEYRLAPEHPFPKPLEDCYAATQWIAEHASKFNGDTNQLIVSGESAGGNLAAAVALMARDKKGPKLAAQLLIYPIISSQLDEAAYQNCPDRYFMTKEFMQFFWNMYAQSPEAAHNPYASVDRTSNLKGLPRAIIITAEYDPLHLEAEKYAMQLLKADVKTTFKCFPEVIHSFLDLPVYKATQKDAWIKEVGKLLHL